MDSTIPQSTMSLPAAAITGSMTIAAGSWAGFVILGAVGGIVGHLIWVERSPEKAALMSLRDHIGKIVRNMGVSGFLGMMIYLAVLAFNLEKNPIAYMVTGIVGLASIDFALLFIGLVTTAIRGWAKQVLDVKDEKP